MRKQQRARLIHFVDLMPDFLVKEMDGTHGNRDQHQNICICDMRTECPAGLACALCIPKTGCRPSWTLLKPGPRTLHSEGHDFHFVLQSGLAHYLRGKVLEHSNTGQTVEFSENGCREVQSPQKEKVSTCIEFLKALRTKQIKHPT